MGHLSPAAYARDYLPEMVVGMLEGLSLLSNDKAVTSYSNIRVARGVIGTTNTCDIFCDIKVTRNDGDKSTSATRSNTWLASIPTPGDDGIFTIQGKRYYTVMRIRLIPNSPMCRIKMKQGKPLIECAMRSENMETLESVHCVVRRSSRHPHNLLLIPNLRDVKPMDLMSVIRTLLNSSSTWEATTSNMCRLLGASETILAMVESYYPLTKDLVLDRSYFPSTTNPKNGSEYFSIVNGLEISTNVIALCQMLVKYLALECSETSPDDHDDYSNCIVDSYAVMICKLLRKKLRMLGTGVIHNGAPNFPRVFIPLVDAIVKDSWEVMSKKDTDLKISRQVNAHNSMGLLEATREVVVYASPMGYDDNEDVGYTRRLLHPSQDGFICKVRTSDDMNAGLKMYLASDCRVSRSCKMFKGPEDDNHTLRSRYYEKDKPLLEVSENDILWLHNHRVVGHVNLSMATNLLLQLRQDHEELCWSMHNGVLESRYYYGRLLRLVHTDRVGKMLMDTRSSPIGNIVVDSSRYSALLYEIPFCSMMPVARSLLSTKIVQKAVSYEMRNPCMDSSLHLAYGQRPLVTTTKSDSLVYGTNVFVCYATLKGKGVEDGVTLNQYSVERGLFSTVHHILVEWSKRDELQVRAYSIDIDKFTEVKQGKVLCSVVCIKGNGEEVISRVKHDKPFTCYVEDVVLSFTSDSALPKDLVTIKVMLVRYKRLRTGDKLSSRYGQKAVTVKVLPPESMPIIESDRYPPQPDIVINPLSMLSRATMSQDLSSALGLEVLKTRAHSIKNELFGPTYIVMGDITKVIDTSNISGDYCYISDGDTGVAYDEPVKVGLEYYLVLDHVADNKCRVTGPARRDDITGGIVSSRYETSIRYNWQELGAMLHSKSYKLLSDIYNGAGIIGAYPFCTRCKRDVDAWEDSKCEYCGSTVDTKVHMARPFAVAKRLMQCIGVDAHITT